jgi:hypothetical protein
MEKTLTQCYTNNNYKHEPIGHTLQALLRTPATRQLRANSLPQQLLLDGIECPVRSGIEPMTSRSWNRRVNHESNNVYINCVQIAFKLTLRYFVN